MRWRKERKSLIENYYTIIKTAGNETKDKGDTRPACLIPNIDVFSKDALDYMEHRSSSCLVKRFGKITMDGVYILKGDRFSNVYIQYIRRGSAKGEVNNDHIVVLSEKLELQKHNSGI